MSPPGWPDVFERWQADPGLLFALLLTAALYVVGVRAARRRGSDPRRGWPLSRTVAFLAGLAAVGVALEAGLDGYSGDLLSVHMVQHLVLGLVAAPLLLAGAPVSLALRSLPGDARRCLARALRGPTARVLSHPGTGLLALGVSMLLTHLTPLYGWALDHPLVHDAEHALYLGGGLLFWAVLVAPGPPVRRLSGIGQVLYLSLGMPLMSIPGVVLEADPAARYHQYLGPARRLGVSALSDQRLAGALMWMAGALAMGIIGLSIAWRALVAEERRAVSREEHAGRMQDAPLTVDVVGGGRA
ncbi:MAG: cytochrome c oxidase assembly protein [Solirubrobacteraceae bacterium]